MAEAVAVSALPAAQRSAAGRAVGRLGGLGSESGGQE